MYMCVSQVCVCVCVQLFPCPSWEPLPTLAATFPSPFLSCLSLPLRLSQSSLASLFPLPPLPCPFRSFSFKERKGKGKEGKERKGREGKGRKGKARNAEGREGKEREG